MLTYALLFATALLATAVSGAANFGGALLLLPLLPQADGVADAVPLLTLAQLVGNLSRVSFGWRLIQWRPVLLFLLGAAPVAAAGARSRLLRFRLGMSRASA